MLAVAVLLSGCGGGGSSSNATAATPPASAISLSSSTLAFSVYTQGSATQALSITLTSTGAAAVAASSASLSDMTDYSVADGCPAALSPGASCVVTVTFAPQRVAASFPATLTLTGATGGPATVALTGSSTAAVAGQSVLNTVALTVDSGPLHSAFNQSFVSVTVCTPGTTTCQAVDHVLVDTGSTGLRIFSSALTGLNSGAALPAIADAVSGSALADCTQYASGYMWGAVRGADIKMGGELAAAASMVVIADSSVGAAPAACSSGGGTAMTSVAALGSNGIIGLSVFAQDCGDNCVSAALPAYYYACSSSTLCTPTRVALARQVSNPVSQFASDNNGIVIQLPAIAATGATGLAGTLTFGIGTQPDNGLGAVNAVTVLALNYSGELTATTLGQAFTQSFLDTGSNGLFFTPPVAYAARLPACSSVTGFYCPSAPATFPMTFTSGTTSSATLSFALGESLEDAPPSTVAYDVAGTGYQSMFLWGLPFFYGRTVYVGFEGTTIAGHAGPFNAF